MENNKIYLDNVDKLAKVLKICLVMDGNKPLNIKSEEVDEYYKKIVLKNGNL